MVRNWYVVLLFATKLFGPVRGTKYGTKLFGSVRGSKTWYDVIWFGSGSVIFPYQFGTNYLFGTVRFFSTTFFDLKNVLIIKKLCPIGYPDRTDFEPTYLFRNWFGPKFFN